MMMKPALARALKISAGGIAICLLLSGLAMGWAQGLKAAPAAHKMGTAKAAPVVHGAWVRLSAVPGRPAAAYFNVHGSPVDDRLLEITSPLAGRIEMHSMSDAGGVMRMERMTETALARGAHVHFAPGGNHLMLFDVATTVKPGTAMMLTLRFAKAGAITVNARVLGAADAPPAHDEHAHP
jgi:hypothetical protein